MSPTIAASVSAIALLVLLSWRAGAPSQDVDQGTASEWSDPQGMVMVPMDAVAAATVAVGEFR
eukprot:CAMPEP_0174867254 /NCGR_PEP_ID=MMETSP1114-20130205/63665_1 /TAXON_ID=312471 /ORGANISM="Neobodo designis, Strain CCAP 1951/1" /LENGTH=62 /DNA_ID=CAMNT_0016102437 /DNA_START=68 /DNA_END=252 /DNA_ORIENTATION=+